MLMSSEYSTRPRPRSNPRTGSAHEKTFERTGTGMTGQAVALKLENSEEKVLVAASLDVVERAAAGAG